MWILLLWATSSRRIAGRKCRLSSRFVSLWENTDFTDVVVSEMTKSYITGTIRIVWEIKILSLDLK